MIKENAMMIAIICLLLSSSIIRAQDSGRFSTVSFDHKRHQGENVGYCVNCHENGPGKILDMSPTWAHNICQGCHFINGKGPIECEGCHNKKA
jgi:hypothetical protein